MAQADLIERIAIEMFNAHMAALGAPLVTSLDRVDTAPYFRAGAARIVEMVAANVG